MNVVEEDYRRLAQSLCPRLANGKRMAQVLLLNSKRRMAVQRKEVQRHDAGNRATVG